MLETKPNEVGTMAFDVALFSSDEVGERGMSFYLD